MEDIDINYDNIKKTIVEKALFFILIIVFLIQFAFFTNAVSQTVEIWPIVYSKDNDAANGIRLSQVSDWTIDNKYYNYGNLYFRISKTISNLNPINKKNLQNYLFSEESDKVHHFSLMIISLFSLYGISFLISFLITKNINQILVSMILLNTIFMTNKYWISKVFGVHPDLLLCFFITLALFSSIKLLTFFNKKSSLVKENNLSEKQKNTDLIIILTGFIWGLAVSVKLSALFFLPALLLLFLPLKKEEINIKFIAAIKFFAALFFTYFLSGFPQNFEFMNLYSFIKYQSAFSIAPTADSFNEWFILLYRQYTPFLPFIFLIVAFFSDKSNKDFKTSNLIKILAISFIPFCFLLQRNITSPHEHYTLPMVSALILATTYLLINLKNYLIEKKIIHLNNNSNIFVFSTLILSILFSNYIPNQVVKAYDESQICKSEANNLYSIIKSFQLKKLKVHVDPYVPFNQQLGYVRNNWFKTFEDIAPDNADVLILSKKYYSRYTESKEVSHYIKQDTQNFDKIKEFYDFFNDKNQVKDKYGQEWKKNFYDNCGWEIWERTNLLKSQ